MSLTWVSETCINFPIQSKPSCVTSASPLRLRFSKLLKYFKRYFKNTLLPQFSTYKITCSTVAFLFPVLCLFMGSI